MDKVCPCVLFITFIFKDVVRFIYLYMYMYVKIKLNTRNTAESHQEHMAPLTQDKRIKVITFLYEGCAKKS